jgi:hypothetical protein
VNGSEAAIKSAKYNGSWTQYALANSASNLLTITGASSFSDYTGFSDLAVNPSASVNPVCSGTPTTVSANATGGSGTYSTYVWDNSGTGASFSPTLTTTTTYNVTVTDDSGASTSGTVTVVVNPLPAIDLTVGGTGSICSGTSKNITVAASVSGINYQLRNSNANELVGAVVAGTGSTINLPTGNITSATTYNVLAIDASTGCSVQLTGTATVSINPLPVTLSLSGSTICTSPGGYGTITSTTSEIGVNYQLYDSGNNTLQGAKAGTGSGLTWSSLSAGTGFYVIGTNASTSCLSSNSNAVNIDTYPNPIALVLSGSNICTTPDNDGTITSTTSVSGVNYQLYNSGNNPVQIAKAGNGTGLSWSGLAAGTGYYVIGTNATTSCASPNSNTVDVGTYTNPSALVLTGSTICASPGGTGTITSLTSVVGVTYQLYNSSNVALGSSQAGTTANSGVLTWSGLSAGTGYYVKSTDDAHSCVSANSNGVDVATYTNPTALVLTGSTICASPGGTGTITSNTSVVGVTYQLYNSSNSAVGSTKAGTTSGGGILTWSSLPAGTGYYVKGTDDVHSCVSPVSNAVDVATNANPVAGDITGSSSVCMGSTLSLSSNSTGTPILTYTWNSSNTGVATVSNTGVVTPVSAGAADITYTVTDGSSTLCAATSAIKAITVNALPTPSITGSSAACASETGSAYSVTSVSGHSYAWSVAGGTISAGAGTNAITVTWGTAGTGSVDLTETITATGCSAAATQKAVTINALPTPDIIGSATVCAGVTGFYYNVSDVVGHTYSWSVSGGTITAGADTHQITVAWGAAGTGTLNLTETITATGCSAAAAQKSVTINAVPSVTTAATTTICSATSPNISLTASVPSDFTWTIGTIVGGITGASASSGATINQTLTNPSNSAAGSVEYLVTPTATTGSCPGAAYSITVTVNPILPVSVAIAASANPICQATPVTFTATPTNGGTPSYQWYKGASLLTGETASTYLTSTLANSDAITVVMTSSQSCKSGSPATSSAVTMTVYPTTAGGTLSGGTTPIALGESIGTITLASQVGTILKWQELLPSAGSWIDVANTTTSLTDVPNSVGTWQYRAVVQSGSCNIEYTTPASIVVGASDAGAVTGGTSPICLGSSTGTLTAGGYTGSILKWQKRADSGSWADISNTAATYSEIPSAAGTWDYRAVNSSLNANSAPVTISVNALSVGGTVSSAQTICSGTAPADLTLSGNTGNVVRWEKSADAAFTSPLSIAGTSATLSGATIGSLSASTYFRAVVQNGNCSEAASSYILVTVNALPTISSTTPASRCDAGSVTLGATASAGTVNWYAAQTGGSAITTGTSYITPSLGATTTYWLDATANSCTTAARTSVVATINPLPTASLAVGGTGEVCPGTATSISVALSQTGVSYQLRNNAGNATVGSAVAGTGGEINLPTGNLTTTTTFNILATNATTSCAAQLSNTATVTVNALPVAGDITGAAALCAGSTLALASHATGTGTLTYTWNSSDTGAATVTNAGLVSGIAAGAASITYTVTDGSSTLCAATSAVKAITVNALPTTNVISGTATTCAGTTGVAYAVTTDHTATATYLWSYSGSNATLSSTSGKNITIDFAINATSGTLTVVETLLSTGCSTTNTKIITVNALPSATSTVGGTTTLCYGTGTNITVASSEIGVNYQLRKSAGNVNVGAAVTGTGGTINLPTGDLTASSTFNVLATNSTTTCSVQLEGTATVTVDLSSSGGTISSSQTICGGSLAADLTLSGHTGDVIKWQKSAMADFSLLTDIAENTSTLSGSSMGILSSNTYFRAVVKSGTCGQVYSSPILVSVSGSTGDWQGTVSTDWNNPANWCSGIPTNTTDVIIPAGVANMPEIGAADGIARNITISAGASITTRAGGKLIVTGNIINNGTLTMATSTTVEMNSSSAQSIGGSGVNGFENLTINASSGVSLLSNVNVNNRLTLTAGTLNLGAHTLTISGLTPVRTSGSIDASNSSATLVFANPVAIALPASVFSGIVNNLTISGAGGVTAGSSFTINGILNLAVANPSATKGLLEMTISYGTYPGTTNSDYLNSYVLTMGTSAITVGIGDVTGTVKRNTIFVNTPYTFGHQQTTLAFSAGIMPTDVSVSITIGTTPPGKPNAIKRSYEIMPTGGTGGTVTANFHYLDSELNGNTEAKMVTWDYDIAGGFTTPDEHGRAAYDFTNNFMGLSNIPISYFINTSGHAWRTIFMIADYAVNYYTWNGSASSVWGTSTNWTPRGVPSDASHVIIPDAATTLYDPVLLDGNTTINTITIEKGGILTMDANSITINNTLSGGWEDQNPLGNNPGTSKVFFAMPGSTISGNARFYDVEIGNGADISNQAGSSMKIANTITKTGTGKWFADVFGSTIEYNGAEQTVLLTDGLPNYHNLILSGSGNKTLPTSALELHGNLTFAGTVSVIPSNSLTVKGNLILGTGTELIAGNNAYSVGGNLENNGANFDATGSTFTFNGTAPQTIGGTTASTFDNITLENAGGVVLGNASTINGTLSLNSGKLTLGNNNLTLNTINAIGGMPGSSNYIVYSGTGRVVKYIPGTMDASYLLPIGISSGYSPVTFKLNSGTVDSSSKIEINLTEGKHPNIGNVPHYINRYWTFTPTGFTAPVYDASFTYLDADVKGSETSIKSAGFNGAWTQYSLANAAGNLLTVSGANSFADFTGYGDLAVAPSADNATICVNEPVMISANATGGKAPYSYAWTPSQGNVASFTASPASTSTYNVTVTDADGASTSGSAAVTVKALPDKDLVVSGSGTICYNSGANIAVSSSASGINYQLRKNADNSLVGTAVAGTGGMISLPTGNLTATTTFNVLATNAATLCATQLTRTTVVNVTPAVTITPFSSGTSNRCQGAGTLILTTTAAYYSTPVAYSLDATTAAFTGNSINASTGAVTFAAGWNGTTTITASAAGCNGPATTTHVMTVIALPAPVITGPTSVCNSVSGETYSIAKITGRTYAWTVGNGTITSGQGTNSITVSWGSGSSGTVNVTETLADSGCSKAATQLKVTIKELPRIISTTSASLCDAGTVLLGAAASEGEIRWYATPTDNNILGTGISFNTPIITTTTTYYAEVADNSCLSASRTAIKATVNTSPAAPIVANVEHPTCSYSKGSVVLNGLPSTGSWTITRTPGGTTKTGTGATTTWQELPSGNYTFTVTNTLSCSSLPSQSVVISAQPSTPNTPTTSPASNLSQTTFTSNWSNSATATGYRIDVTTDIGFTAFVAGYKDKDVSNVTSVSVSGLSANTLYYYRIRAYNPCGSSSNSASVSATTLVDPPIPASAAQSTNIAQTSFTPTWNSSPTAIGYRLDVSTDIGFSTFVSGYENKDLGTTTSAIVSGLAPNTVYYYRIRAYNAGGTSANTAVMTITTLPNIPSSPIANPAKNILQTSFTANWSSAATATGYRLDVATDIGFTSYLSGYNDKDVGNVTSTNLVGLNARTSYYYRLRAYNAGGTSASSNTITLRTLSVQPNAPVAISATSCNNLITLKWRKGVSPYFLRYRIYGGLNNNPTTRIDSTGTTVSDTVKIVSGLIPDRNYYFRVTVVNDDGSESTYSNQIAATVKQGLVPKIALKWNDVLICYNLGDSISGYQWYLGNSAITGANGQYYSTNKTLGIYKVFTTDNSGCQNFSNAITVNSTKSLTLYPNPASVNFTLRLNNVIQGRAVISIINAAGQKIFEVQSENISEDLIREVAVSHLDDGVYVVQVMLNNEELYFAKMVVKK